MQRHGRAWCATANVGHRESPAAVSSLWRPLRGLSAGPTRSRRAPLRRWQPGLAEHPAAANRANVDRVDPGDRRHFGSGHPQHQQLEQVRAAAATSVRSPAASAQAPESTASAARRRTRTQPTGRGSSPGRRTTARDPTPLAVALHHDGDRADTVPAGPPTGRPRRRGLSPERRPQIEHGRVEVTLLDRAVSQRNGPNWAATTPFTQGEGPMRTRALSGTTAAKRTVGYPGRPSTPIA